MMLTMVMIKVMMTAGVMIVLMIMDGYESNMIKMMVVGFLMSLASHPCDSCDAYGHHGYYDSCTYDRHFASYEPYDAEDSSDSSDSIALKKLPTLLLPR